jgi:K+/H+ antiporter YhaU regulatory subunit KhtT
MLRGLSLSRERLLEISELMIQSTIQNIILSPDSPVLGKTLRDLNLRTQTGATVLAVIRDQNATTNPGGEFQFQANDVLVLWGGHQELADAIRILKGEETHSGHD